MNAGTDADTTSTVVTTSDGPAIDKRALTPAGRERIAREAAVLAAAAHPGVIEVIDASPDRLRTRLAGTQTWADRRAPSTEAAATAAAQLATTIADLHAVGVTHGAIASQHVVWGPRSRPILCGFAEGKLGATRDDIENDVEGLRETIAALFEPSDSDAIRVRSLLERSPDARAIADAMAGLATERTTATTPRRPRIDRARAALVGWIAALVGSLALLHTVGAHHLPTPPLDDLGSWIDSATAPTIAFTAARFVALGLGYYLLSVTCIAVIDAARHRASMRRMVPDRVEFAARAAIGAGVLASILAPFVDDPDSQGLPTALTTSIDRSPAAPPITAPATTVQPPSTTTEPATSTTAPRIETGLPAPSPTPELTPTWTVEAGDHLWAIAEETVIDAWGRQPSDGEIVEYWVALIAHNRSRLPDPDNPDLIVPGQIIELPPVGPQQS